MPLEIELAGQPCWMLLMTASSAARCSVSFSRRCVSSKRRAFSQRDAHAGGDGGEQPHVGVAEGVLALDGSPATIDAEHAVAADDRAR